MSSAKRDGRRLTWRIVKLEQPPALRRGREHWVVRWIGAAKYRSKRSVKGSIPVAVSAHIINLRCADTHARPVRPERAGKIGRVLLFEGHRSANIRPL